MCEYFSARNIDRLEQQRGLKSAMPPSDPRCFFLFEEPLSCNLLLVFVFFMVNKSVKRIQLSCRLYVQLVIYLLLSVLYPDTHTYIRMHAAG